MTKESFSLLKFSPARLPITHDSESNVTCPKSARSQVVWRRDGPQGSARCQERGVLFPVRAVGGIAGAMYPRT